MKLIFVMQININFPLGWYNQFLWAWLAIPKFIQNDNFAKSLQCLKKKNLG